MRIILQEEMLDEGLRAVNFTPARIQRAKLETNRARFKAHYGVFPVVCCVLWQDLQTTTIKEARVKPKKLKLKYFFMALHTLRKYPTEIEREAIFDVSIRSGRDWSWFYVKKIQALKAAKIVWPEFGPEVWIISVDGQHCWKQEPHTGEFTLDPEHYSHKFAKAAWSYELALSLTESRLVWINGPFPAGMPDQSIFTLKGLMAKLKALKKKAIGDSGYSGPQISSKNKAYDRKAVRLFKARALFRQEKFNGRMKTFESLNGRFRHNEAKFKSTFEAIAVLCQYEMENGMPMFDILIPQVMEAHQNDSAQQVYYEEISSSSESSGADSTTTEEDEDDDDSDGGVLV